MRVRIMPVAVVPLSLILFVTGCGQPKTLPDPELDTRIQRLMEQYHVPGVSIAVINDYEIDWVKGYGIRESGGDELITTYTLFQAASLGKPITAVAAMHFVEQGLLTLDEDVNNRLVSWKVPENEFTTNEKVTLRRLLSHSAGITASGFQGYAQEDELPTLKQILYGERPANTPSILVDFIPGTQRRYSGGGYLIIQQILEDVIGKPFKEIIQETIFTPVGMTSSLYAAPLPQNLRNKIAIAHTAKGQPDPDRWHEFPEFGAGGGLWTTSTDLALFTVDIIRSKMGETKKLLSQEMTEEMLTSQGVDSLQGLGFSMLWDRAISHTGHNPPGFANILIAFPTEGWGVVVLTNGDGGRWLRHEIILPIAQEYGLFPSGGLLIVTGISFLFFLVTVILWPVNYLFQRWRNRKLKADNPQNKELRVAKIARNTAVLETLLIFTVIILYIIYFSFLQGSLAWSGSIPLVKILYALALISVLLAVVLVVFTVLVWKNQYWSIPRRIHYMLFTSAVSFMIYIVCEFGHTAAVIWVISLGVG